MSSTEEWREALVEWYDTLVEAASVFSIAGVATAAEATTRAEKLAGLVRRFQSVLGGCPLPEGADSALPPDARTAVADGDRVIRRLVGVRVTNSELFIDESVQATPATVHFLTEVRTQARQLGRLYTKLRSRIPALHDRQFAARVPRAYALPLIENALTSTTAPIVMAGITLLYESGVPAEYAASAVDPATLDTERAGRILLAYQADLPPEYAGAMT